ncbi:MAG: hypothetical protein J6Y57_04755, partial [Lachnospiraceae bacterium]|nr:hypothetical protein [Lachnospiraceae bacterium]
MNTISQYVTNSYIAQRSQSVQKAVRMQKNTTPNGSGAFGADREYERSSGTTAREVSEIRRMLTGMERTQTDGSQRSAAKSTANRTAMDSILDSMQRYSDSVRTQRQQAKDTSLTKKKCSYHFKSISAQIIRSKTSMAARQAVSQATREILKLKREKMSGKYDSEEIEAAILHAESMERIARKKVKHLEAEELAKAAGSSMMDTENTGKPDDPKKEGERFFTYEREVEQTDTVSVYAKDSVEALSLSETISDEEPFQDGLVIGAPDPAPDMEDLTEAAINAMMQGMEDLTDEVMDALSQGMRDLMDEMGLSDLADLMGAGENDPDPEELKK